MYRRKEDLLQLIQSLSGAEKRYFVNFCKAFTSQDEQPLYLQLYRHYESDKSNGHENYSKSTTQALTMAKTRLYENILKSQRIFHQRKSFSIEIQNILCEVEILYNLSLSDQSLFLLKKAYKLAVEHEKFGLLLQILEWESRLNIVLECPTRKQSEIVIEEERVLAKQQQFRRLEHIYAQAEAFKKEHGFVKGGITRDLASVTIKEPGMPKENECLSQKARFYYYFINSLYYWMTFEHEKAFSYSQKLLKTPAESLPPGDYINGLLEHITSCVCMGKFKDALKGIELGTAFIEEARLTQSHAFTGRMFAYKATYEMIIYNYMGNRSKLAETIRYVELQLKHFDQILTFESRQVIVANLMNAYMGLGDLNKADEVWDSLFNKQSKTIRRDIFGDLYLFRLFSLLHSGTYELIPSAAQSALRYYRKFEDGNKLFEMEIPIANLLHKEKTFETEENRREVLQQISKVVGKHIKTLSPMYNFQEHYTRYAIWINSLMAEVSYSDAANEWYNLFKNRPLVDSKQSSKLL